MALRRQRLSKKHYFLNSAAAHGIRFHCLSIDGSKSKDGGLDAAEEVRPVNGSPARSDCSAWDERVGDQFYIRSLPLLVEKSRILDALRPSFRARNT